MAAMAFSFQFYDPVVKCVQLAVQMLNFVLDGKREAEILSTCFRASARIASRLPVLTRRVVMASPPPYEKGPAIGGGAPQSREKIAR
jgi:hypothetical protein